MDALSKVFNVRRESIKEPVSGRRHANVPRKLAIYCCQHYADLSLKEIADYFGYSNPGSVTGAVHSVKRAISAKELVEELREVRKALDLEKLIDPFGPFDDLYDIFSGALSIRTVML